MGRWSVGGGDGGPWQRDSGSQAGGAASPRASAGPKVHGGERSKSEPGGEGGGEAVLVVTFGADVLVLGLGDEVAEVVE